MLRIENRMDKILKVKLVAAPGRETMQGVKFASTGVLLHSISGTQRVA